VRLFAFALAGACAGFLPLNLPKARVFLGDVGSHVLGAAVFGLMLLAWRSGTIDVLQALLLGTVLLLDSGYTLLRRLLGGRKFWRAHRDHLYQYAVRRGHSHVRVCLSYAAGTVISIALALSANGSRSSIVLAGLLILNWLLGTLVYFGLRQYWLNPSTHRGRDA
jgi:UDP-N-acetylmuramyl pentapeptide phosphotransferase/UDP-N-acetylglucosamine-1-phosphate transferase